MNRKIYREKKTKYRFCRFEISVYASILLLLNEGKRSKPETQCIGHKLRRNDILIFTCILCFFFRSAFLQASLGWNQKNRDSKENSENWMILFIRNGHTTFFSSFFIIIYWNIDYALLLYVQWWSSLFSFVIFHGYW